MGVGIVTENQQPRRLGRLARWTRNTIISAGLAGLLALTFHTAPVVPPPSAGQHDHAAAALISNQGPKPVPPAAGAPPQPPASGLAPTAGKSELRPAPADPAGPANKRQTSLQDAAGREHPAAGTDLPAAPDGPPPVPRGRVLPTEVLEQGADSFGGCLKEYGDTGQCVPAVPPSLAEHLQEMKKLGGNPDAMNHSWSCTELRTYFPNGVAVRQAGVDPQHLDTNADGRACGAGD